MKKHNIYLAAVFSAAALIANPGIAAETAPAAAKNAPAKPKFTDQEVQNKVNELKKNKQINPWAFKYEELVKDYSDYYQKNLPDFTIRQKQIVVSTMLDNAMKLKDTAAFDQAWKIFNELPEKDANGRVVLNKPATVYWMIHGKYLSAYTGLQEIPYMDRMFNECKDKMDFDLRMGIYPGIAKRHFKNPSQIEALLQEILQVRYATEKLKPDQIKRMEEKRLGTLSAVINMIASLDPKQGNDLLGKYVSKLDDVQIRRIVCTLMDASAQYGDLAFHKFKDKYDPYQIAEICTAATSRARKDMDRPFFEKYYKLFRSLPEDDKMIGFLIEIGKRAGGAIQEKINTELDNRKDLTPRRRFDLLETRCSLPGTRAYFAHPADSYPKFKAAKAEQFELIKKNPDVFKNMGGFYQRTAQRAIEYGDFVFAKEMIAKAMELNPKNPLLMWNERAQMFVREGKNKDAADLLQQVLDSKVHPNEKIRVRYILFALNGGTFDAFDKEFADLKLTSEQKMTSIRVNINRWFYEAGRFDIARAFNDAIIEKMFKPAETDRHYTVKYLKNAPQTAETWAKSEWYNRWDVMETRFMQYYGHDVNNDAKLLKEYTFPPLKDEYKAGLHIVYDDNGVHIYTRMNDPKVDEVRLGKRNGAGMEWVFRPGDSHAYHSFFYNGIPDCSDPHYVNWAAPTKHYRLTYDIIFKDAVLTPEGYVAHTFIPWIGVYDRMPAKDNVWRIGVQISNGEFRTLSGLVHELGRCILLDFEFTPARKAALNREICIRAFNHYNKIRQDGGGVIQNWSSRFLGDPDFDKEVVTPFVKELDEAGKKLMAPCPDSEIPAILEKYVPVWAEITYVLEEKRQTYLQEKLFREE